MMVASDLSVEHWIPVILVAVAAAIYVVRQGLELAGKSPGAEMLRRENEDLLRRNTELEQTVDRHEALISSLQQQVSDLKRSDQAAVLAALREHEVGAVSRAKKTHSLQQETNEALGKIISVLETQTVGGT